MFLSSCSCSCTDFIVVQWISSILGYVMNALYEFLDLINIANIGLCIILFTIIVKLLMLPMTIKQQKFTRLSSVMNPELQAIQKKYRNKTDQDSMIKMREETNAVYEKYGTSASGGCLQLLIQMPIIFALYAVIASIPTYVNDVELMYRDVSKVAYESIDEYKELDDISKLIGKENKDFSNIVKLYYTDKNEEEAIDVIYEQFSNLHINSWQQYEMMYETSEDIIGDIKKVSEKDWDKFIKDNKDDKELLEKYKNYSDEELDNLLKTLKANENKINKASEPINDVYGFVGINLSKSPSFEMGEGVWWALLIPILSALSQWFSMKISQSSNPTSGAEDNPMLQSMNATMMFMPLMSAFFCYTLPAGLGLYWVIGSVVQIVQQLFINMYFKKMDVNDIIKHNIEKVNKKRAAKGLPPKKITEVANVNVKNIKYDNKQTNTKPDVTQNSIKPAAQTSAKKMGIAAKANMVKNYNENNKK